MNFPKDVFTIVTVMTLLMLLPNESEGALHGVPDLTAKALDEWSVLLSWTAPETTADNPIIDYEIKFKESTS